MRCAIRATSLAILIAGGLATAHGQETGVTQEAAAALSHFLAIDCAAGEEGTALDSLLLYANQLEPELRKLLVVGPDAATQNAVRETLDAEWGRRVAFLSTHPQLGLSPDDLLAVHAVEYEEYLEQGAARFATQCRERAVIGLAAIGSPTALSTLREEVSRVDDDLRELIQSALGPGPPRPENRNRGHLQRADPRPAVP